MTQRLNPQLLGRLGSLLVVVSVAMWFAIDVLPGTMTSVSLMAMASIALGTVGLGCMAAGLVVRLTRE